MVPDFFRLILLVFRLWFNSPREITLSFTGSDMATAMTTLSGSARRRLVKFTSDLPWLRRLVSVTSVSFLFFFSVRFGWLCRSLSDRIWILQALGIKGKMFAKKRYAEKALMKKTWVSYVHSFEIMFRMLMFLIYTYSLFCISIVFLGFNAYPSVNAL